MRTSSPSSTCPPSTLDKPATFLDRADAARAYGRERGYTVRGGRIYDSGGGRLARGWDALAVDLLARGALFADGARFGVTPQSIEEAAPSSTPAQEAGPISAAAQEAIAVKRPGPRRRPAKSTTTPAPVSETPAAPQTPPGQPMKTPPKRPRPAPSADPYAADAELPGMEPTTREQVAARRQVGVRRFLDAVRHVLSGRGAAAQHSMLAARGAFRRAAYEAEVLATAEHREAAALDAQEQFSATVAENKLQQEEAPELLQTTPEAGELLQEEELAKLRKAAKREQGGELPELQEAGEGGGLGEPRPEIAGLARTLIKERSGGGTSGASGAQGGDPGGGPAAPSTKRGAAALSPELEALAALITGTPERPGAVADHRVLVLPPVPRRPRASSMSGGAHVA